MKEQDKTFDEKITDMIPLFRERFWIPMQNDIERYQKIKQRIIDGFNYILAIAPAQVRVTIEDKRDQLEDLGFIWDFEEMVAFISLAQIHTTTLLSSLRDKDIADYAAPHEAVNALDHFIRLEECAEDYEKYSNDISLLGATYAVNFTELEIRVKRIDWQKGWS